MGASDRVGSHGQERIWSRIWPWSQPAEGIDFGNGQKLGAEDVLESHFKHMASRRRLRSEQAVVQVGDNLLAAIEVLAPTLAPLTELAEEVATVVPVVQPAPEFRRHLHQALEQTHRQQSAQRVLGTRPAVQPSTPVWSHPFAMVTMVVLFVATAVAAYLWRRRNAAFQAAS